MNRPKPRVMRLLLAAILFTGLCGCFVAGDGDGGPVWGGPPVFFVGGYYHDYGHNAFHNRGGHWSAQQRSARGRASMGPRAGGGGHAPAAGGRGGHGGGGHK